MSACGATLGVLFAGGTWLLGFTIAVGYHGHVSDWYWIPFVAWMLVCAIAGGIMMRSWPL